ncbi:hypothetical protein [Corynebacterium auriscanis]|uniref:hypothetical protein n=1 Tax=Corynebacterium auriscanis TaxID=99807 RepID=UPI003CF7F12B
MNTQITLDEAALTTRTLTLDREACALFDSAHAVGGITLPGAVAGGSFPATARQWIATFSRVTGAHADNLRRSVEQITHFARDVGAQEVANGSLFTSGPPGVAAESHR